MTGPPRIRPRSLCVLCEGRMERKATISEKPKDRHWGDADPFLELGQVSIQQFICIACGHVSAYQVGRRQRAAKGAVKGKR